jgi:HSP20 family protein
MIYTVKNPGRQRAMALPHFGNIINEIMNTPVQDINKKESIKYSTPAANVVKYDNKFEIILAIPGLSKKDLTIQVDNGKLTIANETEIQEKNYQLREFNYGKFKRSFELPEDINVDGIEAKAEDGILYLTLPLIPEAEPKKITIK